MINILFVCLGNICRSPMAEAVFMHKVRAAGLTAKIRADSAGTGDWHVGQMPHQGTRAMLKRRGIEYSHAARVLSKEDFNRFDLILTMDEANYETALRQAADGTAEVRRLLDFAPDSGFQEVPDPYYNGNFGQTYDLTTQAADGLLEYLRERYKL